MTCIDRCATPVSATASGTVCGVVRQNEHRDVNHLISRSHACGHAGGLVGLDTGERIARSFYATTDAQGRAINRFAASSGKGLFLEQLLQMPALAVWHGKGCQGVYMTDR